MPRDTQRVCGRAQVQTQAVWLQHLREDPLVLAPKDLFSLRWGETKGDRQHKIRCGLGWELEKRTPDLWVLEGCQERSRQVSEKVTFEE